MPLLKGKTGVLRRGLLDAYLFYSLAEVRIMANEWQVDYNTERPHKSLGYLSPVNYARAVLQKPKYGTRSFIHKRRTKIYSQVEESRLVDKVLEKPENSN